MTHFKRMIFLRITLLLTLVISLSSCAAVNRPAADSDDQKLGIELLGVRYSAAGYMLDFRYLVNDPESSMPMFDRATIPFLIHEKSGAKFMVPNPAKVGPLRATTRKPEAGKRYFIIFANPGKYIKQGELVTVVVGDYRFEHLPVK